LTSPFAFLVESYGKANLIEPIPAYPELVVSICYTSVSTDKIRTLRFYLTLDVGDDK
jgi:hypothetical protein